MVLLRMIVYGLKRRMRAGTIAVSINDGNIYMRHIIVIIVISFMVMSIDWYLEC